MHLVRQGAPDFTMAKADIFPHYKENDMGKKTHLTLSDRNVIEADLNTGKSLAAIAADIGKSQSTVSREIRARRITKEGSLFGVTRWCNPCVHAATCHRKSICENPRSCNGKTPCASCRKCIRACPDYVERLCPRLKVAPYVCNGCPHRSGCRENRRVYDARKAQKGYEFTLVDSRNGIMTGAGEIKAMDRILTPLMCGKGQSVYHIVQTHEDEFNVDTKTVYNYLHMGAFTARAGDAKRIFKIKPRKGGKQQKKIDKKCREGRTYDDFRAYIAEHGETDVVEMDSVIGQVGGKPLLTFYFRTCGLLLAFIRERNTSQSVIDVINGLYDRLGAATFRKLFPVILTDNGCEFSNPGQIEEAPDGEKRTKVFYCNPYAAYEKPHVEREHELIRNVLPKGTSFDTLDQGGINKLLSHIGSYVRANLGHRSPIGIFTDLYGRKCLETLGLESIPPDRINLTPRLLFPDGTVPKNKTRH